MTDPIHEVAQAARSYTAAHVHRAGLAHQLALAEERALVTHERVRELLPEALAACPDAVAWRRVVEHIEALPDGDRLIVGLAPPLPQEGEIPWPEQQRTA